MWRRAGNGGMSLSSGVTVALSRSIVRIVPVAKLKEGLQLAESVHDAAVSWLWLHVTRPTLSRATKGRMYTHTSSPARVLS